MSVRNARTGRHEDDIAGEAFKNDGWVTPADLLAHAQEIIVEAPDVYGRTTSATVSGLLDVIGKLADTGRMPERVRFQ